MQSLSFPSRQKQPLISLRHRVPSSPWIRWIIHGAADHGNIRWKQRFSHPRPRPGFAFFGWFIFQWRGRTVSEWSCWAQPASINLRLFSSILVNCLWKTKNGNDGKSDRFHAAADRIPLLFVRTKFNECGGIARRATVAALNRNSIIFRSADFVFSFRLVVSAA